MDILTAYILYPLVSIIVLSILIFVHELGHFLFAKWNKVTVLEFAVGFGRIIWQKKVGTTRYSLRLIPLGGYVRMAGDDYNKYYSEEEQELPEGEEKLALQPVHEAESEEERAILEDRSRWFFEKGILARSSIVFAGPLFNFIMAWFLVFFVYLAFGANVPSNDPKIGELIPEYPAQEAGLLRGDVITKVGTVETETWQEVVKNIAAAKADPVDLVVQRETETGLETLNLTIKPKAESTEMQLLDGKIDPKKETRYLIGIQSSYNKVPIGIYDAAVNSFGHIYFTCEITLKSIWHMIAGNISAQNIGGPITIVKEAVNSAERGIERLIMFVVFISISLGVLNLLPIPVLDGGHLLMFFLEALVGGRLNRKFVDYANQVGMFVLLALMVFAIGNDIFRLVK